ncbi:glycosyltransferase [candidate division KSB1 bacterium]
MVKISVIIVNYNVKEYLEQCLLSVKKSLRSIDSEIIIVDNASGDGSQRMIRKKFPDVKLIENRINLGFSRANNIALRKAKGKYITLLNPDTLVQEDTFELIINAFDDFTEAGMIGGKVLNPDGTLQLSCRRSFPDPRTSFFRLIGLSRLFPKSRTFGKYNMTYLDPDEITEVDAISGSFMTIRKEVLETAGYLDEDFFMYGEDLEWCYQIRKAGWKIYYYPRTSIVHYKGESSRKSEWNRLKLFYTAMEVFAEKHIQSRTSFTPLWLIKIAIWLRGMISHLAQIYNKLTVPAIDIFFINCAFLSAVYLRYGEIIRIPPYGDYWGYIIQLGVSGLILTISLLFHGVYPSRMFDITRSTAGALTGSVLVILLAFFTRDIMFSRLVFFLFGLFIILFIPGWRVLFIEIARFMAGSKYLKIMQELYKPRGLIIGSDKASIEIYRAFKDNLKKEIDIVGLVSVNNSSKNQVYRDPVLGELSEIKQIVKSNRVTDIIFPAESHSYDRIINTVTSCQPVRVNFKIVPSSLDLIISRSSLIPLVNLPLIELEYKYLDTPGKISKRLLDLIISGVLLIFSFPVYGYLKLKHRFVIKHKIVFGDRGRPVYIKVLLQNGKPYEGKLKCYPLWMQVFRGELSFVGRSFIHDIDAVPEQVSLLKLGIIGIDSSEIIPASNLNGRTFELHYLKNYSILYDFKLIYRQIFSKKMCKSKKVEADS